MNLFWVWLMYAWDWFNPERVMALATVVYAVVTIVMFFSIRSQARTARRAAEYAQTMSDTASKQLAMVQRIERPWLIATVGQLQEVAIEAIRQHMMSAKCTIRNCGKTPAWITAWINVTKVIEIGEELPPEPDYGEEIERLDEYPLPPEGTIGSMLNWHPDQVRDAHRDKLALYAFGFVSYRDGFGRSHETRFCYRYYPPFRNNKMQGFHLGGPPEYNNHT
jgi:hypothetical protein